MICREFADDLQEMMKADTERLAMIDGVGAVIAAAFCDYFKQPKNKEELALLLPELSIAREQITPENLTLQGKIFVITGSLNHFENRSALKEEIERRGGKVTGSVTSKTDALINNDTASASAKNKKAKELDVPVLSEDAFLEQYLQ